MTFKKADMAKTLKIRFSMIETNPLNHKWLDFVILTGLALHQFQKKMAVKYNFVTMYLQIPKPDAFKSDSYILTLIRIHILRG